jgi:hypothetical protein
MIFDSRFTIDAGVLGHFNGTPHSCGSGLACLNDLPDKSGVPSETGLFARKS